MPHALLCCVLSFLLAFSTLPNTKGATIFPATINLSVPFNQTLTLEFVLKKEEDTSADVVEGDGKEGITVTHEETQSSATYMDGNHRSLFLVEVTDGRLVYSGTFFVRRKPYSVSLASGTDDFGFGNHLEREWEILLNGEKYKISQYNIPGLDLSADEVEAPSEDTGEEEKKKKRKYVHKGRQDLLVEVLLIIDQSTYHRFLKIHKDDDTTIHHIKYYYCHIMAAVNDNFQRIRHDYFSLSSITTALYIAKTPEEAAFIKVSDGVLRGTVTLNAMASWQRNMTSSEEWPDYDATVMINDHSAPGLGGLAYISSVCDYLAVSLVQRTGPFATIQVITHELGHILGSHHDGNNNSCEETERHIMTPNSFSGTNLYYNEGNFSSCSLDQFAARFQFLNEEDRNCLLNRPSTFEHPLDKDTHSTTLLGQFYTLDQQCQMLFGKDSYFCRAQELGDELCKHIVCYNANTTACMTWGHLRAMHATSCGNKKWCVRGACVYDPKAPEMEEKKCYWGDRKEMMELSASVKFFCKDISEDQKGLCYKEEVEKKCCETCEKLKDPRNPECLYGDREAEECKKGYCTIPVVAARCCDTCSKRTASGCHLYEPSFCQEKKPIDCYSQDNQKHCCQTCLDYKNHQKPHCLFGDKSPHCVNSLQDDPDYCDTDEIRDLCCGSC